MPFCLIYQAFGGGGGAKPCKNQQIWGGEGGVFPVFTLLGNPKDMDLRNAYMYSLPRHLTV